MVDLVNMRVSPLHPEASDYRLSGQPDSPIPDNSIDLHVHIRSEAHAVAAVGLHTQSPFVIKYTHVRRVMVYTVVSCNNDLWMPV